MRRHIVILALASLCAAASPSRAEQASSAKEHREKASTATTSHRARATTVASRRPRLTTTTTANRRLRARTAASRRPAVAAPAPVTFESRGRKKPRLIDPLAAMRALLLRPTAALTPTALITEDLPWIREEWETRPVAAPTSGFVPSLSTDDWRLLMAAGLSGFALVSPITPAMGFPGLRTHQRPAAGLVCLENNRLGMCLPAISVVKDPYYENRWAGISVRVFEGRF